MGTSKTRLRKGAVKLRAVDYAEHTGQFVYCGNKAQLAVGNVLPLAKMPEGTVISMCEEKATDRGRFARAGGTSCMIVGHSDDGKKTRIRLPSGSRKTIP